MTDYAFTSITRNYLPKARVLARLVKEHSPDARFCLVLAETGAPPDDGSCDDFDEVMTLDHLKIPELRSWIFKHELVELCTAVKGFSLCALLDREDCESVFYFDPDIVVFCSLETLKAELAHGAVLLTPHLTAPDPTLEAIQDNELSALRHGVYNLGFLGVENSDAGRRFAHWWRDRLHHFCYDDIPAGMFTDQRWVDLAPAFFAHTVIVRHPGWNVATWNLPNRHVEGDVESGFRVNGEPLRFYHFSGLDSGAQLVMLDKYGSSMPALYALREWYLRRCAELDALEVGHEPWALGYFDNGAPIEPVHRVLYRQRIDLQRAFPDPFATNEINSSYYHWFEVNHQRGTPSVREDPEAVAALYRRELQTIYTSRSWKLVCAVRKASSPLRAALRSLGALVPSRR